MVQLAATVTPGVAWYAAPLLPDDECRGRAYGHPDASEPRQVVFVSNAWNERYLLKTALHEAQHAVESLLTPAEMATLNAAIDRGSACVSAYASDPMERRAELFSAFASYLRCGGRHVRHREFPENDVLAAIQDGTVGRRRLRQRIPTPVAHAKSSFSDRLIDSLGLRPVADWLGTPSEA